MTSRDWLLLTKETKRKFASATWVPLRVSQRKTNGLDVREVGYVEEGLYGGAVAIPPGHEPLGDELGWSDIGIGHSARPYAYEDHYSPIEEYEYSDRQPIGTELVFEYHQPVVGGRRWIINPDIYVALRLVKEGDEWLRPEEDFAAAIRERVDEDGNSTLIEIRREFLIDYLAARNLAVRMSYYIQRVVNVSALEGTEYEGLTSEQGERDGGRFELRVNPLNNVFGGNWRTFRAWRTDVDDEMDAPVLGPENNDNVGYESHDGTGGGFHGLRLAGEFWGEEWIRHNHVSTRVRGDTEKGLPDFIVDTDGSRLTSAELNHEEVGRWLWFRPAIVNDLLSRRGFSLKWYTRDTGGIRSTSGYSAHFGINSAGLLTLYAEDVARLPAWEQRVWAAHNVAPEGKVSKELLDAQVRTAPAETTAPEVKLFEIMFALGSSFEERYGTPLYTRDINSGEFYNRVSRFIAQDRLSLLRLAKELVRSFSDRLNIPTLRKISNHKDKDKLGSNKLLESILA